MRFLKVLWAGSLLLPSLAFSARPTGLPSDPMKSAAQQNAAAGMVVPGNEITNQPNHERLMTVTGKVVTNDEHKLVLDTGDAQQTFDVRKLAFTRSLKSGQAVAVELADQGNQQVPRAIYLVGASSQLGPVASEPQNW